MEMEMEIHLHQPLQQAALRCYQDQQAAAAAAAVQDFLHLLSEPVQGVNPVTTVEKDLQVECERLLATAKAVLDPATASGQALLDLVALDLPSIIVKYVVISSQCQTLSEAIMTTLCDVCNPRELFPAYMEALHLYSTPLDLPFCDPLLRDLATILSRITRRRVEFFKETIPGLLEIARIAVETSEQTSKLLDKLVLVAMTVCNLCVQEQAEKQKEMMHQMLGIFTLRLLVITFNDRELVNMAVTSSVVVGLCKLLSFGHFPHFNLLTGSYLREIADFATKEYGYGDLELQEMKKGAALAVYWGLHCDETANENMEMLQDKLAGSQRATLDALCNVKALLAPQKNSWHMVEMGVGLLLDILKMHSVSTGAPTDVAIEDWPEISLQMGILLQVIEDIVIFAPNKELRQHAYTVFIRTITEVLPVGPRFDNLRALIINSQHPSMACLLLGCVKDEVSKALTVRQAAAPGKREGSSSMHFGLEPNSPFESFEVLNLIQFILQPAEGGPPDLPHQIDAVLGALNLYRFVLIKETTGKSNYTGVTSKSHLQKVHSQWLLPLREVLACIRVGFGDDNTETSVCILLAVDNLEGVLFRCLELVEEALRQYCN